MTESTRQDLAFATVRPGASSSISVFARKGATWSEVTALDDAHFRIRLGGLFRTAWMASLCSGLAQRHLSIEQAHARATHDGSWIVELNVLALPAAVDPMGIAYLEMADSKVVGEAAVVVLESYELGGSTDHGASFFLTLEARDTLGLLGALLMSLARLDLVPIEMHIDTRAGRALDSLWLATLDGAPASQECRAALDELLASALPA